IAGVIGPKGDAFIAAEAPDAATAETYHRPQIAALAAAGADFLFAPTLPALDEAIGVARAMVATGLPYVLSFGLAPSGRLMDGHDLGEAIAAIDA
ncbi:homocysteine S-methyltransferase family protein, partial [Klebsiella pneumoniae]